jgi:nucleoside-diphosphate-sugar epimerase
MLGDIARLFGHANMLTSDKLRELRHLDWSIPTTELARVPGWSPQYSLEAGFADAVHWYRSVGWL